MDNKETMSLRSLHLHKYQRDVSSSKVSYYLCPIINRSGLTSLMSYTTRHDPKGSDSKPDLSHTINMNFRRKSEDVYFVMRHMNLPKS